jgi:phage terminase Nu1 subunit (DNA packaging protein)
MRASPQIVDRQGEIMSSINGFGDVMVDWASLLAAYKQHAELLGDGEADRAFLAEARARAFELKNLQESLRARKQEATQQLNEVVRQGKEVAMRMRSLARHRFGARNEGLVLFKVAPVRKRRRRGAAEAEPAPE